MITNRHIGRGRLGNQMFQYAFLRGIAAKTGYDVAIPTGNHVTIWKFGLNAIELPVDYLPKFTFQTRGFTYKNAANEQPDDTNFLGYYQSEKYFLHIEDEIRSTFHLDFSELDEIRKLSAVKILVAMHVRRGDYVNHKIHSNLFRGYYFNAMEKFKDVTFVIVSDDIEWCKRTFNKCNAIFFEGSSMFVDLMAIALCHHQIISCSTFGWWGAWLATYRHKRVVRPSRWWAPGVNLEDGDICPATWESVSI